MIPPVRILHTKIPTRAGLRLLVAVVFLGLSLGFFAAAPALGQRGEAMVDWLNDYEAAIREAKRTGKPIFLEFRCVP